MFRGLRRGRPRLKLQEKVGWVVPPWAGVTVSSDRSVKSPVSGCLLVSSFTIVAVMGAMKSNTQNGTEGYQEGGSWVQGTLALTFAIRSQKFPIQVPAKGPCRVASLRYTCPHLEKEWRPQPPTVEGNTGAHLHSKDPQPPTVEGNTGAHLYSKDPLYSRFSTTLLGTLAVSSEAGSTISGFPGISGGKTQS